MRAVRPLVACLLCLLALYGCSCRDRSVTPAPPAPAPVSAPASSAATASDEPTLAEPASVVTSGAPVGLPAGFPLPTGVVSGSEVVDAEEGVSFTVAVESPDPPAKAAEAYAAGLRSAGYSAEVSADPAGGVMVVFTRGGERLQGAATFEPSGSGSRAGVTLTVADGD